LIYAIPTLHCYYSTLYPPDTLYQIVNNDGDFKDVESISIEVADESYNFFILIDGKVFGPYQKIRISPYEVNSTPVHLPIMTYFPINSNQQKKGTE
jgi:hypothetical protein